MADNETVIHIGENSPEQVAYKLLTNIASVEGKVLHKPGAGVSTPAVNREWILNTYRECIRAVRLVPPE